MGAIGHAGLLQDEKARFAPALDFESALGFLDDSHTETPVTARILTGQFLTWPEAAAPSGRAL